MLADYCNVILIFIHIIGCLCNFLDSIYIFMSFIYIFLYSYLQFFLYVRLKSPVMYVYVAHLFYLFYFIYYFATHNELQAE